MSRFIDLRSDTVTRPTEGMRRAMHEAPVGDDVFGDDLTVNLLQDRLAQLFGMEAALFFPSGTMANQVAIKSHTVPGNEVICDEMSHVYRYEGGGIAANSGVSVRLLKAPRGIFSSMDIRENINADDAHFPKTTLVEIENTVNRGGGACWPAASIQEVCDFSHQAGLKTHLDGARLWNALVATGQEPAFFGKYFDSISVCFSKGMGAPVGSVLLGNKAFIYEAHRNRKRFGGGMRQIGGLAAACLYALDHHLPLLKKDHERASRIAEILGKFSSVVEIMPVETNVIYFRLKDTSFCEEFIKKMQAENIHVNSPGPAWIRFVFHLDIDDEMENIISQFLLKNL